MAWVVGDQRTPPPSQPLPAATRPRSICNCNTHLPKWLLRDCTGPLCDLLRLVNKPRVPMFDLALPSFDAAHLGSLLGWVAAGARVAKGRCCYLGDDQRLFGRAGQAFSAWPPFAPPIHTSQLHTQTQAAQDG